ncbi:MAG: NAD-dependent epimerase/dehydratase family protein [Dermatophilaceae bacterium]
MTRPVVVVLGAAGFVGAAVHAAALADSRVGECRGVRRPGAETPAGDGARWAADPRDAAALHRVLDGADIVVNAAHVVGGTDLDVNATGPGTVATVANRGGVRCLEVGTAAVYGRGPLRGGAEGALPVAPDSPLSVSRATGEARALAAGATVIRPMIVVGAGDRWAVPAAAMAARGADRPPSADISAIGVADLARLVVDLAVLPDLPPVVHAARPDPVPLAEVLAAAGFDAIDGAPVPAAAAAAAAAMLHLDRWVEADLAWELAGRGPAEPLVDAAARAWYSAAAARSAD